jgi:hypothetical protein
MEKEEVRTDIREMTGGKEREEEWVISQKELGK